MLRIVAYSSVHHTVQHRSFAYRRHARAHFVNMNKQMNEVIQTERASKAILRSPGNGEWEQFLTRSWPITCHGQLNFRERGDHCESESSSRSVMFYSLHTRGL